MRGYDVLDIATHQGDRVLNRRSLSERVLFYCGPSIGGLLAASTAWSWPRTDLSPVAWTSALCMPALLLAALGMQTLDAAAQARPKNDEQCLSPAEVRELVSQKLVLSPEPVLRKARLAGGAGAKVLRAVLCRREGQYVYRITLLRRDGRVVHQLFPARSGRVDAPRKPGVE